MVLHFVFEYFRLTPIGPFALVLAPKSDPAALKEVEIDLGIFIRYAISRFDTLFVFHASVCAAQTPSESNSGVSMTYDF